MRETPRFDDVASALRSLIPFWTRRVASTSLKSSYDSFRCANFCTADGRRAVALCSASSRASPRSFLTRINLSVRETQF